MLKAIIDFCRLIVGSLFIVSGLIKANDAMGFMYKLEEYFEAGALNLPELTEWALPLAVFICLGEILLGVAMVLGAMPKITAALTGLMMAFFTWLTWYTANCDPHGFKEIVDATGAIINIENQCVLACGCFGNAIPLTPYESFIKDVVLSILTIPIVLGAFTNRIQLNSKRTGFILIVASLVMIYAFSELMLQWNFPVLFAACSYAVAEGIKMRWNKPGKELIMALGVALVGIAFQWYTLNHLPLKDYRAYAVGESIIENSMTAEELGKTGPVYATEYTFKNLKTGLDTIILSSDWLKIYNEPWFKESFEIVTYDGKEIKIADGYEPQIQDFQILNAIGDDIKDSVLSIESDVLMVISKDLELANLENQAAINDLAKKAQENGWFVLGLSNVDTQSGKAFQEQHDTPYDLYTCDQTELKIIVRSNPGLVWLKKGTVQSKWAWRDIPTWESISTN
ncbi:MAG: DoxX family protein [Flavobacteriales bacterium]